MAYKVLTKCTRELTELTNTRSPDKGPLIRAEIRVEPPLSPEQKNKAAQVLGASIFEIAKVPGFSDQLPEPERVLSEEHFNELKSYQKRALLLTGGQVQEDKSVLIPADRQKPASVLEFSSDLPGSLEGERIIEVAEFIADVLKSEGHQSTVTHEEDWLIPQYCEEDKL